MSSFNYFSKIVLINLSGETERLENSLFELNKIGISDITDIRIVPNYDNVPITEIVYHIYEEKYNIIKEAKANNYDNVLILEDDVVFESNAPVILQNVIDNLPSDWDLLYLTGLPIQNLYCLSSKGEVIPEKTNHDPENPPSYKDYVQNYGHFIPVSNCLYKLQDSSVQLLQALVINNTMYDKFIENFESLGGIENGVYLKHNFDIDLWLAEEQESNNVITYYACPVLATHRDGISIRTGEIFTNVNLKSYGFYIELLNNLA